MLENNRGTAEGGGRRAEQDVMKGPAPFVASHAEAIGPHAEEITVRHPNALLL